MTDEELDEARGREAWRLEGSPKAYDFKGMERALERSARLAREGWTPPPPVDPDLLAVREIVAREWEFRDIEGEARKTRSGTNDLNVAICAALAAYKAGKEAAQ
jgi:hypothetical protein